MEQIITISILFSHILLTMALGYYIASNMQWYSYKISRVLFHHTKYHWHLFYFAVPFFAYYLTDVYFWIYFYFAYLPFLYRWYKKLDKPLIFTKRIKRVVVFLFLAVVFQDVLCLATSSCKLFGLFMPLFFSFVLSHLFEWMQMQMYEKQAKEKIQSMPDLTIVAITASYGKTSIKNFLYHLLQQKYKVYKTPRSVNTKQGIIQDINNELSSDTQIYIVEAGARQKGDIAQIVDLLSPQLCIVGKIGSQHIEYFKTLEAIRDTKMELVHSARLSYAIVHESANIKPAGNVSLFKESAVSNLISNLDGIGFSLEICGEKIALKAPILGAFNAQNIALACFVAKQLGITNEQLQKGVASLESVEHRLQKIEANGKIIIDDSFNGNLEGMLDSYALVKEFASQKVIITPGIVESTKEANITLAKAIDEVFDLIILPPSPNQALLASQIKSGRLMVLKNKEELQKALLEHTHLGDLILFSNDTPSYM